MIEISTAPPFATVQDLGRLGHRASGVPVSGAMDPDSLRLANSLVGNPPDAAVIEWALGGGSLIFRRTLQYVVTGAVRAPRPMTARVGDTVALAPPIHFFGRFIYVAVEGGIDVPMVLGSRSTYLPGAFGGYKGRILRAGDEIPVGPSSATPATWTPTAFDSDAIRVILGPHRTAFTDEHRQQLLSSEFKVAQASDRMGYRLDGPPLTGGQWGTRLSEPVCPGAIQITADGNPIVLMPDGPTVGGYPVIGVVHSADLGRLAQRLPSEPVRFVAVSIAPRGTEEPEVV
jgi:biotin-dependent carboxylase-like uncharacterized protein